MHGDFMESWPSLGDVRKSLEALADLPDAVPVCGARYRPPGVYRVANEPFVTVALPDHTLLQWPCTLQPPDAVGEPLHGAEVILDA